MRVLLTDLHSTLSQSIARLLQDADHEVLGTVPSRSSLASAKRRLLLHPSSDRADAVKEPVAVASDKLSLAQLLASADAVVATSFAKDPASAMALLQQYERCPESENGRRFVALSSVLTWSKNTTARGLREDDFKTRKPARKYAALKTFETQLLSASRAGVLDTCVVAAGLVYGGAQSDLLPLFRDAWLYPSKPLRVPGRGDNLVPMVGVYDLALVLARLAMVPTLPKSYVVATDRASAGTTLRDVCVGLSVLLGGGGVQEAASDLVSEEDEDEDALAALQLHLSFDESPAMAALAGEDEYTHAGSGLLANLGFYVDDFVTAMDLRPLRTLVLGPPRVGKTLLSQRLAREYYVPHVTVEGVAAELLETAPSAAAAGGEEAEAKPESDDDAGEDAALRRLRVELRAWREAGGAVEDLPEATVVALLRWRLATPQCLHQGYVLDGAPVSAAVAAQVFDVAESERGGGGGDGEGGDAEAKGEPAEDAGGEAEDASETPTKSRSQQILERLRPPRSVGFPNRVVMLHAPVEELERRAQALGEAEAAATSNTQAAFHARYATFQREAEALASFFEARRGEVSSGVEVLELHATDEDEAVRRYMEQGGGRPFNFRPTRDEVKAMEREHARRQQEELARRQRQEADEEARDVAAQRARLEAEEARLALLQREEAALLEARAKPLRTYLMDTVLPALSEGMLEVVRVQPADPVDYLAEFLFQKGREMESEAAQ